MTGRARGRARGRSRGQAAAAATRPGEKSTQGATSEPQVGRGGRGRAVAAQPTVTPVQQTPPPQLPVEKMAQMTVKKTPTPPMKEPTPPMKEPTPPASGAGVGRSTGRGGGYTEPCTRPEHIIDKRGTSGTPITVMSNFVSLKNRPDSVIYQYNVGFSPQVDSKRVRYFLIAHREDLIGTVKTFDGMILYLPIRLPDQVTKYMSSLRDGTNIEVTITLTNDLNTNSPVCMQLFNIIFRR